MSMSGEANFYTVSNREIYTEISELKDKVVELEKQILKITTVFGVIAFIITPVLSVFVSTIVTNTLGNTP